MAVQARFFKSRSLAAKVASGNKIRVDGEIVAKAHFAVRPGNVLTFPQAKRIRVIRILALGTRRGPAPEAQALYEDLSPEVPRAKTPKTEVSGRRDPGAGRPTKADRRAIDKLIGGD